MEKKEAINTTRGHRRENTVWTDGSRLEDRRVRAAFVWRSAGDWSGRRFRLGAGGEIFDGEVFAIYQALLWIEGHQGTGGRFTIFADSTAAIERRARTDALSPGKRFAAAAIEVCDRILARGDQVTIRLGPLPPWDRGKRDGGPIRQGGSRPIGPVPGRRYPPGAYRRGLTIVHGPNRHRDQTRATAEWIKDNVRAERRYKPLRREAYAVSTYETQGRN